MTPYDDPFDLLAACRPEELAIEQAPETAEERAAADALLASVLAAPSVRRGLAPVIPLRRRRMVVVAGVVLPIVLISAAWAVLQRHRATLVTTVRCHASIEADAPVMIIVPEHGTATEMCAEEWMVFVGQQAPLLVGCVGGDGRSDVYPGGPSVCQRLGLELLDESRSDAQASAVNLVKRLSDAFTLAPCADESAATELVNEQLQLSGSVGWTITVDHTFDAPGSCYGPAIDEATRVITLVMGPPLPSIAPTSTAIKGTGP